MQNVSLSWLVFLVAFSACGPSTNNDNVSVTAPSAKPSATKPLLMSSADSTEIDNPEEGMSAEEIRVYRAHQDSVQVLNTILSHGNLTLTTETFTVGDLNGDGQRDFIVLAHGKLPCDSVTGLPNTHCRTVLLVLNSGWPTLTVAASNAHLVDCSTCGGGGVGDPHQGFETIANAFTVNSLYGDCDKAAISYTFCYNPKENNWFLQYSDRSRYSCHEGSKEHHTRETKRQFGMVPFASFKAEF